MSMKLSKIDAAPYEYFSEGDGSKPITAGAVLDRSGGQVTSGVLTVYLVSTAYLFSNILLQPINEEAGIDWQISLDNAAWGDAVAPADTDATAADRVLPIYLRVVAANDGSVNTANYTLPDIEITYTESP